MSSHSVSEHEAFILDIIVAVHDGRLKNAILLNSKKETMDANICSQLRTDIFAYNVNMKRGVRKTHKDTGQLLCHGRYDGPLNNSGTK
jgi:hypothetical protein